MACWCIVSRAAEQRPGADHRAKQAETQFRLGNYATAYDLASGAADGRAPAWAQQLLANVCFHSGRLEESLQHAGQYLRLTERSEFATSVSVQAGRQDMALLSAEASAHLGHWPEAEAWFARALKIPQGNRRQDPVWEARAYLRQARLPRTATTQRQPLDDYRQARELAERILSQDSRPPLLLDERVAATDVIVQSALATSELPKARSALDALLPVQKEPAQRAVTLCSLADVCDRSGDIDGELEFLRRALDVQNEADSGKASNQQGRILEHLAEVNEKQAERHAERAKTLLAESIRRWREAADCYRALNQPALGEELSAFDRISNLQQLQQIYQRLEAWPQAQAVAAELLALRQATLLNDDPQIVESQMALGTYDAKCARLDQARGQLEAAARYWRQRKPRTNKELAETLRNLAEVAREEGKFSEAQAHLEEALEAFGATTGDQTIRMQCLVSLANVLAARGRYDQAVTRLQEVEQTAGNLAEADTKVRRLLSLALLGRASIYKVQLRLEAAIKDGEDALRIVRTTYFPGAVEELPYLTMLATLYLARYDALGAKDVESLTRARQNIELAYQAAGRQGEPDAAQFCSLLHVLALVRFREAQAEFRPGGGKDPAVAQLACSQAIDRWMRAAGQGESAVQARSMNYLAEVRLLCFDYALDVPPHTPEALLEQALADCSRAIRLVEQLEAYPGLNYRALLVRAKVLRRQSKRLEQAGQAAAARQKVEAAVADLVEAVAKVEAPRSASLGADPERAEFFSQFIEAYELLVNWLVELERFDDAVAYAQISRNRTFIEQILVSEEDLQAELAQLGKQGLLDEFSTAQEDRDRLREQLQKAVDKSDTPAEKLASLRGDLARAQRECDRLATAIRAASKSYQNLLHGGLQVSDWQQARRQILADGGVLLVYHLGTTASQTFVVTPDDIFCHPLQVSKTAAEQLGVQPGSLSNAVAGDLINRYLWRRGLQRPRGEVPTGPARGELDPLSSEQAVRLAEIILPAEVRRRIAQQRPAVVHVIPDGAVHRLPLESLLLAVSHEGDFESKTYLLDSDLPPLAYAPSAMILAALQSRAVGIEWPTRLLTVGGCNYRELAALHSSARECENWKSLFASDSGDNVRMLLGDEATTDHVREQVRGQDVVHFAVHGRTDTRFDSVFASALALTPGHPTDDGLLYLRDVHRLPLSSCALAVLSACQSNIGPSRRLEAGASLSRAFLSAGANRVVSSLWLVDDEATAALMGEFGRQIAESLKTPARPDYALALHRARRKVRQNQAPDWSEPHFWAPFVLIGPAR